MIKKYGKIAAAAAFLTAAGLYYSLIWKAPGAVELNGSFSGQEAAAVEDLKAEGAGHGPGRGKAADLKEETRTSGLKEEIRASGLMEETGASGLKEETGVSGLKEETGASSGMQEGIPDMDLGAEESAEAVFFVHICGEVMKPGVYGLKEGSRIFQAVEAAGGFTPEAAGDSLNLAALIHDGMKVQVPSLAEAQALTKEELLSLSGQTAPELSGEVKKVNLNTAGVEELTALNGIGKARAEEIVRYRTEHGKFQKIEEIKNIPGIKDALFQKIKDRITV